MLFLSALVLTLLPLTNGLSVGGGSTQAITAHPSAHTTHAAARHAAATHALGRRALLASALSGAAALSTAAARADMDDLSAPEDLSAPGPAPVMISTYAPGEKREEKKRDGPYQRIKVWGSFSSPFSSRHLFVAPKKWRNSPHFEPESWARSPPQRGENEGRRP